MDEAAAAAEHTRALRASEGRGAPQDWNAALDRLATAALLGHGLARATLSGLAGEWTLAMELLDGHARDADWQVLRASVDIAAWLRSQPPRILSASPRVALVEGIASYEVCDWLIARARPGLIQARVYNPDTGGPAHDGVRTNRERHFGFEERDLIFNLLRHRMSEATGLSVAAMEAPTILHYTQGQRFMPHHDYLDPLAQGHAREIADRGQRVLTLLVCLNEDYEGGETDFPALARRFKGRKGNALFFWNVEPEGAIDPRTLHAGLPPKQGEKWLLSQWVRSRNWQDSTSPSR